MSDDPTHRGPPPDSSSGSFWAGSSSSGSSSSGAAPGVRERRDGEPGPWGRPWGWWREVATLVPPPPPRGRRADTDLAAVIAAILFKEATGRPWRRLPDRFPPWQTVYSYHRRWVRDGTLRKIREAARRADARRTEAGRTEAPDAPAEGNRPD